VPVLARWIEAAGIPTVVVTMMPDLTTKLFAPRAVGVEFPFGHPFGIPHDTAMQNRVLGEALHLLAGAGRFGTRVDIDLEWPIPRKDAYKAWQPPEPSPITQWWIERNMLNRSS
jgi:hypothetical protein